MIVLGLTGSIGMGKSTTAAMLRKLRVPVHDADAAVHALMEKGGAAVAAIDKAFPGVVVKGAIDRKALGAKVFGRPMELRRLEKILHPLVRAKTRDFLDRQRMLGRKIVVLDIPLLFETGGEKMCDAVIVVTAPGAVQRMRVLARPGMTIARFNAIKKQQMPDREKRKRADYIVDTGNGYDHAFEQVRGILHLVKEQTKLARSA